MEIEWRTYLLGTKAKSDYRSNLKKKDVLSVYSRKIQSPIFIRMKKNADVIMGENTTGWMNHGGWSKSGGW